MLSSNTPDKTDVRTNAPDTKTLAVTVALQLALTVHVPVSVSLAKSPPTLRASVPDKVPSTRRLSLPAAAIGTAPVARRSVPVPVNPYAPAAPANEHCWARADGEAMLTTNIAKTRSTSVVGPMLRFIILLLIGFFLKIDLFVTRRTRSPLHPAIDRKLNLISFSDWVRYQTRVSFGSAPGGDAFPSWLETAPRRGDFAGILHLLHRGSQAQFSLCVIPH